MVYNNLTVSCRVVRDRKIVDPGTLRVSWSNKKCLFFFFQTKLLSISAVAACAKGNLISDEGLKTITLDIFEYATNSDSLEVCREASHCLSFIAEKNTNFIRDKILTKLDGAALQKDTFVLLLCQFVNLEGFMPLEICQKLMKMISQHQYEKTWNDSISAALSGLKGMLPNVKSGKLELKKNKCH